jgi:hypothetical protein
VKLLAFNVIGIVAFLLLAVPLWAEPEVAHIPGAGAGSPIVWVLVALPVFVLCALVDAAFLCAALLAALRRKPTLFVRWHTFIPAAWAAALYVDFSHHWLV